MSGGFDWPALMQAGLRGLGLRPAEFWGLTPAELRFLLGNGPGADRALGRARLDELLAAYPDRGGVAETGEMTHERPDPRGAARAD